MITRKPGKGRFPELKKLKWQKLLASGARTSRKMPGRKRLPRSEYLHKKVIAAIIAKDPLAEARWKAKKNILEIREELHEIREHLGIPAKIVPALANIIVENRIPMENVYDYYKARKKSSPELRDEELWASFIKNRRRDRAFEVP